MHYLLFIQNARKSGSTEFLMRALKDKCYINSWTFHITSISGSNQYDRY